MSTAEQYCITGCGDAGSRTVKRRTRKPGPLPPLAPGEVGHADLLDALHRITGTGRSRGTLTAADAEAGDLFVRALLACRRPLDLRGAARANVYDQACAYEHPGVAKARARSKAYRQANAGRERARHREYYAANRDAICAQKRGSYWADPEKFRHATRLRWNKKRRAKNLWQAWTAIGQLMANHRQNGGTLKRS